MVMLPLYHDPHFTFRFAEGRIMIESCRDRATADDSQRVKQKEP